jgi:Tol biopolymer transport system component
VGLFIIMPKTRRGLTSSCITQCLAAPWRQRMKRAASAGCSPLRRSVPERGVPERGVPERGVPERGAVEGSVPERSAVEGSVMQRSFVRSVVESAVEGSVTERGFVERRFAGNVVAARFEAGCAFVARGAALSLLLAAGCSGEAGDLFPRVTSDGSGATNGGGGSSSGSGVGGDGSGAGAGGAGVTPVGVGASDGLGATGGASSGSSSGGSSAAQGGASTGGSANAGGSGASVSSGGAGSTGGSSGGSAPTCDPCPCGAGPFGEAELVRGLGLAGDTFGPAPSADGLTLFLSAVDGDENIVFATRQSRGNTFGPAVSVPGVNRADSEDGTPFLTFDGSALYFFSTRAGEGAQGDRDLWVAEATGQGVGFGAPSVVPEVNGAELDHLPRLSSDGLALMFVSTRVTSSGGSNIFVSERNGIGGAFSAPVELANINSDARDEGFWLSEDGLTIYFASNRDPDRDPEADMDIWVAERATVGSLFGEPENLEVVNTPGTEIDPAVTADGFELFFASDRNGTMQVFRSARECP